MMEALTSYGRPLYGRPTREMVVDPLSVAEPFDGGERSKAKRYVVADPYLRFWLRFVEPGIELIERGRGRLVAERAPQTWNDYRGRALEPLVRASIERLLPDGRFGDALHVGGYWTRDNRVEVDLVGSSAPSDPRRTSFVGSIKSRERGAFDRHDAARLHAHRGEVPGVDAATLAIGVSRDGFESDLGLDLQIGPEDLVDAWR